MAIDHQSVISFGVLMLLILSGCSVSLGQNITYVGFNITAATTNTLNGQKTVILSGVDLPNAGWLTGFLVTTDANCSFQLQLWRRITPQNHALLFTTAELSFLNDGQQQVDLGLGNAISLTGSEILGFTATSLKECVTFNFVINPLSSTLTYMFTQTPTVSNIYTFLPYQDTNHYGIMGIIQDTQPSTIAYFGFNTTSTDVLLPSASGIGVMLRDTDLMFGRLVAFHVNILGNDCQVYFQLWTTVDALSLTFRMKYTTSLQNFTATGYYVVDVPDPVVATSIDRIVFVDMSPTPCVVFEYTSNPTRFSLSGSRDFRFGIAIEGMEAIFSHFQVTHRFSVMAEIDALIPPPVTGVTGDRGTRGNTGPEGVNGLPGSTGVAGTVGQTGNTGITGTVGGNGVTGPTGPVGPTGSQGLLGNIGILGQNGANGETGVTGIAGPRGPPGQTGVQGSLGIHGSPGQIGNIGEGGDSGRNGLEGLQGNKGATGTAGVTGVNGPLGDTGPTGSQGAVGEAGVAGPSGMQGPAWDPFDVNYCALHTVDCDHGCTNGPLGYTCTCRRGYNMLRNGNCQDIDECITRNGGCQYFCQNTAGSYVCSCPQGYLLANDEHRCDDINECLVNNGDCSSNQICINTWDGHVCVGPYTATPVASGRTTGDEMLTSSMFVGLIIWMAVVTFTMILEVVILLPELNRRSRRLESPPSAAPSVVIEDHNPEFFFPTFFPRVRLGVRDYYSNARSETTEKRVR
ncbi:uncharacterized protein LOC132544475 [Ylistrum balloti]|uniref:uncharacterized protein LOC132544475 n=1 Tax=Ylistrum balloti TaxID=509963 RepID=UPI002905E235|nr:uncharacterized protein LOC132544475 [Ylistrum balloti]